MMERSLISTSLVLFSLLTRGLAGTGDTSRMTEGKHGLFMHYQYRILLNYSIRTDPIMPSASQMTSAQWNRFVDGFDVKGFADRYNDKIAGWWFDGVQLNTYNDGPDDWWRINSIVRTANRKAVIAFSYGKNEFACVKAGIDDYTAGDTWTKQDLKRLTPNVLPPQNGILWHGKIYCGSVYHGQGDANQFTNEELIDWIKACNLQGGVCTLDWPFDPKTGLIKEFGMTQMIAIRNAVKGKSS